jgi:hypothetical protein
MDANFNFQSLAEILWELLLYYSIFAHKALPIDKQGGQNNTFPYDFQTHLPGTLQSCSQYEYSTFFTFNCIPGILPNSIAADKTGGG